MSDIEARVAALERCVALAGPVTREGFCQDIGEIRTRLSALERGAAGAAMPDPHTDAGGAASQDLRLTPQESSASAARRADAAAEMWAQPDPGCHPVEGSPEAIALFHAVHGGGKYISLTNEGKRGMEAIAAALSHAAEAGRRAGIEAAAKVVADEIVDATRNRDSAEIRSIDRDAWNMALCGLKTAQAAIRALPARAPGELDRSGG